MRRYAVASSSGKYVPFFFCFPSSNTLRYFLHVLCCLRCCSRVECLRIATPLSFIYSAWRQAQLWLVTTAVTPQTNRTSRNKAPPKRYVNWRMEITRRFRRDRETSLYMFSVFWGNTFYSKYGLKVKTWCEIGVFSKNTTCTVKMSWGRRISIFFYFPHKETSNIYFFTFVIT